MLPRGLTEFNKVVTNRVLRHLVGVGPVAELEHVGRRSGRRYRTVLMAFRDGDVLTLALTYGPDVDWLRNLRAAGGGRMRLGSDLLDLGSPRTLTTAEGMARMPAGPRQILPLTGCEDFVEVPILGVRGRRR